MNALFILSGGARGTTGSRLNPCRAGGHAGREHRDSPGSLSFPSCKKRAPLLQHPSCLLRGRVGGARSGRGRIWAGSGGSPNGGGPRWRDPAMGRGQEASADHDDQWRSRGVACDWRAGRGRGPAGLATMDEPSLLRRRGLQVRPGRARGRWALAGGHLLGCSGWSAAGPRAPDRRIPGAPLGWAKHLE